MRGLGWMLIAAAALGGCASDTPPPAGPFPSVEVEVVPEWQRIVAQPDLDRIAAVRETWDAALSEVRTRNGRAAIAAEGALLDPDAALPRPAPPPGSYLCRTIKLGSQNGRRPTYIAYKPFFCFVDAEDDLLIFVKQTGSQRPAGRIYADSNPDRLIFVGALALGNEPEPRAYGDDPERDMVGVVERVGPFRYRLVLPRPRFESTLDVLELVPAPQ